ncbi:MAG: nucleotidyltransferase family protein [Proteobacteria bacterium]|nr:nucleotidyltransferase family protein [Pseudomonadota bacterium]
MKTPSAFDQVINLLWKISCLEDPESDILDKITAHTDWNNFWKICSDQGVAPLVYCQLKKHGFLDLLPPEERERGARFYYATVAQNALFFDELKRIDQILSQKKIPYLLLKGTALIVSGIYPDPGLRPLADIDFLVREKDILPALKILTANGFRHLPVPNFPPGFKNAPEYFLEFKQNRTESVPLYFDLHSRLSAHSRFGPDNPEELWPRSGSSAFEGVSYQTLSVPDSILFSSLHLAIHRFQARMIWLLDIKFLLDRQTPDWLELIRRAHKWNCTYPLLFTIKLITANLSLHLPDDFPRIPLPRSWIFSRMTRKPSPHLVESYRRDRVRQLLIDLSTQESFPRFIRFSSKYLRFRVERLLYREINR